MHAHYGAANMVVAAAGKIDHETFVDMVTRAFDGVPAGVRERDDTASYVGGDYRESRSLEQVHVILGFPGVGYRDPDYYTAAVLSTLLGGGMSSRLFQAIREERGLVYTIFAFHAAAVDSGLFGVYAGTGAADVGELLPVVCDEIRDVAANVTEAELDRARAQLKASILMNQESPSGRCEQLANQLMIYGRHIPPSEIVAHVDAVDAAAVRRLAERVIAGRPTLTSLGPVDHVAGYDSLTRRLAA
jgi:predicted Zn-dependent peptidase